MRNGGFIGGGEGQVSFFCCELRSHGRISTLCTMTAVKLFDGEDVRGQGEFGTNISSLFLNS
jgi:hypothetical protein